MHEIQKHILKKLSLAKTARYAGLKPKTVDGNLFVYHLKNLLKEKYILSENGVYKLTSKGQNLSDRMSFEIFKERAQPKIVTLLVIQNKGNYLLYRRKRSPFIGSVGFPYGKIHLEEHVAEAAERELNEKTGLRASLRHRGDVYLVVYNEAELITHMLCHIFSGANYSGTLKADSPIGEVFWGKIEDLPEKKLIPGVKQIIKLLKNNKTRFFAEYFLNANEE